MPSFSSEAETLARWRALPGRERLDGDAARVALTFDDGPDREGTPAVLDALEAEGVRATFFAVGEQLEDHPGLGEEVVARGHGVELHGHTHRLHDDLSAADARAELERGVEAVERTAGRRPQLCRPPYGRFSPDSHAACRDLGLEPVYWSAWGLDWEEIPPERIADLAGRDLEAGAIVVLHDSARYAPRPSAAPTAAALPLVVARARELGLELGPLEP